jgi:hypothetical protein
LKFMQYLGAAACAFATLAVPAVSRADEAPPPPPPGGPIATSSPSAPALPNENPSGRGGRSLNVGVLAGAGFPRPLAVEGVIEIDHVLLLGLEYSTLPTITIDSGIHANIWAVQGDARVFPFKGAFFVGVRAGRQHLGEYASATVSGLGTLSAQQTVDTTFINPRIGFLWNWHAFALGVDAGVQIPLSSTLTNNLPPGVTPPSTVTDLTHAFGQSVLPTVDLLRIGVVM